MANCVIQGVQVAGVASAVPAATRSVQDEAAYFGAEAAAKISQSVGVNVRHVVPPGVCTSDLCAAAAERLLEDLNWKREEVRALIFITQTPDYVLPATSHALHQNLNLPVSCCVFDVNLGCSGYVYGLWLASSIATTLRGKVLLLVGDTVSRICSPQDRSVAFLFGDAGTATALGPVPDAPPMYFELGSDGSGVKSLIVPAGGFRQPRDGSTPVRALREDGCVRSDEDLYMEGPEIFTFTLRRVPPLVNEMLRASGCEMEDVDAFIFHQANQFMLDHLAKKLKVPPEKFVAGMKEYGNTSSASIPLAITTNPLREKLERGPERLLLAGFGVGFSWGGAVLTLGPGVFPRVVEYRAAAPESLGSGA